MINKTMEQDTTSFRYAPPPYISKGFRHFRLGFTLAEVLITLTIIGIIAALTVPTLMNKVQEHGFRSAFLKNYAIIQNAYAKSIRDGLPFLENGDTVISQSYIDNKNLIKDYFKIQKSPFYRSGGGGANTFKNFYSSFSATSTIKYLNGNYDTPFLLNGTAFTFQLTDGTIISFCARAYYTRQIFIDVNGPKGPNTYGKDIYWLHASEVGLANTGYYAILPMGTPGTGDVNNEKLYIITSGIKNSLKPNCFKSSSGLTCAYEIVKNKSYTIPDKQPE